jgi:hypothetical protein
MRRCKELPPTPFAYIVVISLGAPGERRTQDRYRIFQKWRQADGRNQVIGSRPAEFEH